MAASSGLNELEHLTLFQREVQMELACRDDFLSLNALIAMAICLDNLRERRRSPRPLPFFGRPGAKPEPMELGVTHLSVAERQCWK